MTVSRAITDPRCWNLATSGSDPYGALAAELGIFSAHRPVPGGVEEVDREVQRWRKVALVIAVNTMLSFKFNSSSFALMGCELRTLYCGVSSAHGR